MVFIATFKHISVISWQSVLLVEETGENHNVSGDDESIVIGFTSTFIIVVGIYRVNISHEYDYVVVAFEINTNLEQVTSK
jgi:hypothetical protein